MEIAIKKLLNAEIRAESLVEEAKSERKHIVEQSLADIQLEEKQFEERLPQLHSDYLEKAQSRAEQTIGELQRRYQERTEQLSSMAEQNESEALDAAMRLLTATH